MTKTLTSKFRMDESIMLTTTAWAQSRSKDPSSKVGACIHDPVTGGLFLGYNGFPHGVEDREEWWTRKIEMEDLLTKYDLVVHAEKNATRKAMLAGVSLPDASLYCTHLPCPACMRDVICACGIKRVVYDVEKYPSLTVRGEWIVRSLAKMCGVELVRVTIS
jgi:dCMP deaminase